MHEECLETIRASIRNAPYLHCPGMVRYSHDIHVSGAPNPESDADNLMWNSEGCARYVTDSLERL
jgi:hypothetical protein